MAKVTVSDIQIQTMTELPGSWSLDDYKSLLAAFDEEAGGMSDAETKEYLHMMIADSSVEESAYQVLNYVLGDTLNEGQLQNLSNEMADDKMWEEYSDMTCHKQIYLANQLLYKAYNGKVPKGEVLEVKMKVSSNVPEVIHLFEEGNTDLILRMIIAGSDEHAILHRLYDEEAQAGFLKDAIHILWDHSAEKVNDKEVNLTVISSEYWFHSYDPQESYSVNIDLDIYDEEDPE